MTRPRESRHPLLPWSILTMMGVIGFVGGALCALVLLVAVTYGVGYPRNRRISLASMERVDALVGHPLFGTVILAAGIACAIWAMQIAWHTLQDRKKRPGESSPTGRETES